MGVKHKKAKCHPDRLHEARGLCAPCYNKQRDLERATGKRAAAKLRHKTNPGPISETNWRAVGIKDMTWEKYQRMYGEQRGQCKICLEQRDRLYVDHNHNTGKTRSLLCHRCNAGLGFFRESPLLLEAAMKYLVVEKS